MRIIMNTQDLLEGLNTVTRALAVRPPKQILEGVLIAASDGRVLLTCSDGSLTIEYTNAADIQEEGQVVLPGRLLTDLIRKLPGGSVEINVQNQRLAQIRCHKTKSNLSVMSADEFPEFGQLRKGTEIKIPQNKLKEMISHVVFAIATDETRPILTGCLLEVCRNEARMVALDGFRLAMQKTFQPFDLPDGKETVKAIIPGKVMTELSRILPDDEAFCTLKLDNGRMECEFSNIRLSSVLLAGEFIDYRRILPTSFKTQVRADRAAVQDAIDRASLMAREGKNNLIKMSFRPGIMKITSNAEMGDVEEELEADLTGDNVDIAFNARYLIDVIRNNTEDEIHMHLNSSVSPCVVTPQEGDYFLYLILPVRVFQ
ncbi:MAG: DNA polymerase III subunit beta [Clostridia bacterium]|nr:DNA polymerase III subunit beta [Clostridia bacterium]